MGTTEDVSVYKMDMHCESCAKKVGKAVKHLDGVESVKTDCASNKLTVIGRADPAKIKARLEEKTKKEVEIVSAASPPKESTVVLKISLHCECYGCIKQIKKKISIFKGVTIVSVEAANREALVTLKGATDVKDLAQYLTEKLRKTVEVVPQKKEEESTKDKAGGTGDGDEKKANKEAASGGGGDKKEEGGEGPKAEEEEGDAGKKEEEGGAPKMAVSRMEYPWQLGPGYGFDGWYGGENHSVEPVYNHGYHHYNHAYYVANQQGFGHDPRYMNQGYHSTDPRNLHALQMFNDENTNSCSIM